MAKKEDRWIGTKLQVIAVVIFIWGLYGVSFGKIWLSGRTQTANIVTGPMRSNHSFRTFTGGKARGTGFGLMLGAVGLTLLNMSMKRENQTMAVSGLGLMACGVVVYLGSLIFLSY